MILLFTGSAAINGSAAPAASVGSDRRLVAFGRDRTLRSVRRIVGGSARRGAAKAQASLEFLILLAAFLSFLFAWVFVLQGVREKGEEAFSKSFAELALGDLQAAGNEVCLAGDGSAKKVEVSLWNPARMQGQGSFIILSSLNFSSFRKLACPASASAALGKSAVVRVENQGGTVMFTA